MPRGSKPQSLPSSIKLLARSRRIAYDKHAHAFGRGATRPRGASGNTRVAAAIGGGNCSNGYTMSSRSTGRRPRAATNGLVELRAPQVLEAKLQDLREHLTPNTRCSRLVLDRQAR